MYFRRKKINGKAVMKRITLQRQYIEDITLKS